METPDAAAAPRTNAALADALREARDYTLSIYAHLSAAQEAFPQIPTVNLPRWEIGHIGWFQEFWCLRQRDGAVAPSRLSGADALFDSSNVPHAARWSLPVPDWDGIHRYLARTLADTLDALPGADDARRYFFELALYHEDMHAEALLMTLQTLALPAPPLLQEPRAATAPRTMCNDDLAVPGGDVAIGTPRESLARRFVFDNEKWTHTVELAPFLIARRCVTNAEFAQFVDEGGYTHAALWSDEGNAWRAASARRAPAYWVRERDDAPWHARRFDAIVPLDPHAPVMHVNAFEAQAWCRWAGRRLPSEAEWETAARHADDADPPATCAQHNLDAMHGAPIAADAWPLSAHRPLAHMLGNVWEWTASAFDPYAGFAADPYADYSAPWFGSHRVMRGGSWATRARLVHPRFRNFYLPHRHDPFVGFRTCAV
ncbi:MAG TPA: selenoneine synthase SenA [Casimicrobiaceae bacterium]